MKRVWQTSAAVTGGVLFTAMYAMPQAYVISARPGVVNYIEGNAAVNGRSVTVKADRPTFLKKGDVLSTDLGKAEILLTPGVFLRIGNNSAVQMVAPSLTNMEVSVQRGEAMLEVDELLKDNHLTVVDHNASTSIEKNGLYRFLAGDQPRVAVIDGKAAVQLADRKIDLGKGHETLIADNLKATKFNTKQQDDLYAWSNMRSEYAAAASYQSARNVSLNGYGSSSSAFGSSGYGWGGFGFGPWYSPGWYWNSGFNSFAWLPSGMGAFYNPFGYGFYGAGVVAYAPIVAAPIVGGRRLAPVAVNPQNPPAATVTRSPAANQVARAQTVRAFGQSGFTTASGMHVAAGRAYGAVGGSGARAGGFNGGGPRGGGFNGGRPGGGGFSAPAAYGAGPVGGGGSRR